MTAHRLPDYDTTTADATEQITQGLQEVAGPTGVHMIATDEHGQVTFTLNGRRFLVELWEIL